MDHVEDRILGFEDKVGKLDFLVQKNPNKLRKDKTSWIGT